jgi:hypothetical protein
VATERAVARAKGLIAVFIFKAPYIKKNKKLMLI